MKASEKLDLLFEQNNGIVKTAQVLENGITKTSFYAYAKQRGIERQVHRCIVGLRVDNRFSGWYPFHGNRQFHRKRIRCRKT